MNDAPATPRQAPGKRISFVLAVLMHVALAMLLIYGIHWQTRKPAAVEVELVRAAPSAPAATPLAEPKPAPKPEPKPEPKPAPAPEPALKPPPKPTPKPEIAQKEKAKPPKPEPKPEPKPQKPEPPKPDPFEEQLKRESEQLQHRKAAAAAAQDLADLKARQASAAQAGEKEKEKDKARYIAAIRSKVHGNIVLPPEVKGNPEAMFRVTQLPSGEVLNVELRKSSGHPAYDAATERAIRKSSPLPKPGQPELFARELDLTFRPQDD